jgi:citrate lyase subunit beta / citryl-CoA lyase
MTPPFSTIALPLFAPADKPDRYPKALASGADAVIFDLEDAVALSAKDIARTLLLEARGVLASAPCPLLVRINPEGGPFHAADLIAARELPLAALVVPKVESADTVRKVADKPGCRCSRSSKAGLDWLRPEMLQPRGRGLSSAR